MPTPGHDVYMRLVPRQLRRSGFPNNVPYYGGRLTPGVIAGLQNPSQQTVAAPMGAQPLPAADAARPLAALNELREFGLLTEGEYLTIRQRIGAR